MMGFLSLPKVEIWIEAGSRVTRIYHKGELVTEEPTVIAVDSQSGKVEAVGNAALKINQREVFDQNERRLIWPVNVSIADFHAFEEFLRGIFNQNSGKFSYRAFRVLFQPSYRIVFFVPSTRSVVDLRAWRDAGQHAGASEIYFIHKFHLLLSGLGVNLESTAGCACIDVGSSKTEINVFANGELLASEHLRLGTHHFIKAIQLNYKRSKCRIISEEAAEQLLQKDSSVLEWVEKYYAIIQETLWSVLDSLPTDVAKAVTANKIYLYGGGATSIGLQTALSFNGKISIQPVADEQKIMLKEIQKLVGNGFPPDKFIT